MEIGGVFWWRVYIASSDVVGTHFRLAILRDPKARADACAKQIECPSRRHKKLLFFFGKPLCVVSIVRSRLAYCIGRK